MSETTFLIDRFDDLVTCGSEPALLDAFGAVVDDIGGSGFAVANLPEPTRMIVDYNRGLNGWCEYFVANGLVATCAITERIGSSSAPFLWGDVRAEVADKSRQRAVFDAAADFGITDGMIVPVHARSGYRGNVFVRIEQERLTPFVRSMAALLSMAFHSQLGVLHTPPKPLDRNLTTREHDVLSWFAAGKTAEDVAEILGITAGTVMFHYRNVAERFGTLTRTHTVVEAIRRGAISLG